MSHKCWSFFEKSDAPKSKTHEIAELQTLQNLIVWQLNNIEIYLWRASKRKNASCKIKSCTLLAKYSNVKIYVRKNDLFETNHYIIYLKLNSYKSVQNLTYIKNTTKKTRYAKRKLCKRKLQVNLNTKFEMKQSRT